MQSPSRLTEIKFYYDNRFDFYIVNDNYTIDYSTSELAINFDFKNYFYIKKPPQLNEMAYKNCYVKKV